MTCFHDEKGEWIITITTPNGGVVKRIIPATRAPGYGVGTYELLKQEAGAMALVAIVEHAQRETQLVPEHFGVPLGSYMCSSSEKEAK